MTRGYDKLRPSHNDPTADAAIGIIIRAERRERKKRRRTMQEMADFSNPCCANCTHYCFWDKTGKENGCKNYSRKSYRQNPEKEPCDAWKACDPEDGRYDEKYSEQHGKQYDEKYDGRNCNA